MGLHKFTLTAISLALLLYPVRAAGCSCGPPSPPCQAIGESQLVFLGTVTGINAAPERLLTAVMNVDRVFKGRPGETVELFDDGMCDGPHLDIGSQYLMYTYALADGKVAARGCTRSRSVEDAEEDLKFLNEYSAGKVTTHIGGAVRFRPDEGEDGRTPLKGVRVTLSDGTKQYRVATGWDGGYAFSNLPAGEYRLNADLAGHSLNWTPPSIALAAKSCAVEDLWMRVDRRVEGSVQDESGAAVSGALVEMVPADPQLKGWDIHLLTDVSDKNGRYSIGGLGPGDYYLGINIESTPTKKQPYPATYYPGTPNRREAIRIRIGIPASVQDANLRVPHRLSLVTIRGTIQNADGKPPLAEDLPQVRVLGPGLQGEIELELTPINADGKFEFELCEGVTYSALASSSGKTHQNHSALVDFTPTKDNNRLVLILNKTSDEFGKLAPE